MKSVIYAVFLLLLPGLAGAAEYWSLGAFNDLSNAQHERDRIVAATGTAVEIHKSDNIHRLLVAVRSQGDVPATMRELGIQPWKVSLDGSSAVAESTMADTAPVMLHRLVLGSFTEMKSAEKLLGRLIAAGHKEVEVITATVEGRDYYRVTMGPYASRQDQAMNLTPFGINATWWLTEPAAPVSAPASVPASAMDADMSGAGQMNKQMSEQTREPAPAADEHKPIVQLSPPAASEDIAHYCAYKANRAERAVYCTSEFLKQVGKAQANMDESSRAHDLWFCSLKANAEQRRLYCQDQ